MAYETIGPVSQNGIFEYFGQLVDENGNGIPAANLTTLTLLLEDMLTGTIIDGYNGTKSILNTNGGTVDGSGNLTFTSVAADNPIVQTTPVLRDGQIEIHQATLKWTWNSGAKQNQRKIWIQVEAYNAAAATPVTNTLPDIITQAELITALGLSALDGLVPFAHRMAQSAVRNFLGYGVTQRQYIGQLLHDVNLYYSQADYIDVVNNRVALYGWSDSSIAQPPEIPVRSVQSMYADFSALGGQGVADFGPPTLMVQGSDFYLDFDIVTDPTPNAKQGISWSGHIVRWMVTWPSRRRSIKVNYTAGMSAAELDGQSPNTWYSYKDPSCIKWGTLQTAIAKYHTLKAFNVGQNIAGIGAITSERVGDASFTYDASIASVVGMQQGLPPEVQSQLGAFRRMQLG